MGIQYNPRIVTDGLLLALDAANSKSYPGSGTTWTDLSGRGNNGTLTNGPTYGSLKGGSIVFDGTNNYVVRDTLPTFNIYCISMWIKPSTVINSTTQNAAIIQLRYSAGANNTWNISLGSATVYVANEYITITSTQFNTRTCVNDGGSFLADTWYNLVFNYEGSAYKIYINNTVKSTVAGGSGNVSLLTNPNKLYLGATDGDGGGLRGFFNGNISNVQLYNRALTATEISQNYNALAPRFLPPIFDGSISFPFSSPVQAQSLGIGAGTHYFQTDTMSAPQLLEYQPNYYESRPFCCVFRSPFVSTATTNKIDLNIPMAGLLVQRDALDIRGAVYWSTPITYNTTTTTGNDTADSGYAYRRVILGYGGGHGIYNTGQTACNWGNSVGSIAAGYSAFNNFCGSFPNSLVWGTGSSGSVSYTNTSGTWSHWITWS